MTILETLEDPVLFAGAFAGPSWEAWKAFLAALFGLELPPAWRALYCRHTGRPAAPGRRLPGEAWVVVGRRGGKSRIAALIAVYLACFREYRAILAPGERGTLPIIAADRRQARNVFQYVTGLLDRCPLLAQTVARRTGDAVELTNGVTIEVHTASFRSIRGYTVVGAILDEVAFWRSEDSANPDGEIVNALRPAMATVPQALLVAISSPYARRGVLWEQYRRHWGRDDPTVLVWQAPTRAMNPRVPDAVVRAAYEQDEATAAAEYGAAFRQDIESFVAREAVEACMVPGRYELPPVVAAHYEGFIDPSGGTQDAMTLAIAHHDEGRSVLDVLRERRPPFSPDEVTREFAATLKAYGVTRVVADKYAGAWVVEAFATHGITCAQSAEPKSTLYGNLLPLLNSGRIELLDHRRLVAELLGLERRTARGGRDSIDHGPRGHDDLANAVAGALVAAAAAPGGGEIMLAGPGSVFGPCARVDWKHELAF